MTKQDFAREAQNTCEKLKQEVMSISANCPDKQCGESLHDLGSAIIEAIENLALYSSEIE